VRFNTEAEPELRRDLMERLEENRAVILETLQGEAEAGEEQP